MVVVVAAVPAARAGGLDVVIPALALLGRRADVHAGPDDPEEEKDTDDAADDDACDGAAA